MNSRRLACEVRWLPCFLKPLIYACHVAHGHHGLCVLSGVHVCRCLVLHVSINIIMFYYYYVTVLHLSGSSGNGHFSIRVWYYFILRDQYMK